MASTAFILQHGLTEALDTFGGGLGLIIVALVGLITLALYCLFKARALDRWEQELTAWNDALASEEQVRDLLRAHTWAERFPEWRGLSEAELVAALPNTADPHFLQTLYQQLNGPADDATTSAPTATEPGPAQAALALP